MLFRKQALENKKQSISGDIIVSQPINYKIISLLLLAVFFVFVLYLAKSTYSRKSTVRGFLVPKDGVIKVYSSREGIVEHILVSNGDKVSKDDKIVSFTNNQSMGNGDELSENLVVQIKSQINSLEKELIVNSRFYEKKKKELSSKLKNIVIRIDTTEKSKKTSEKILSLKKRKYENFNKIFKKGFVSSNDMDKVTNEYLEATQNDDTIMKELTALESDVSEVRSEIKSLPDEHDIKTIGINREISDLKSRLATIENRFWFTGKAPQSGIVTAIQVSEGGHLSVGEPIMSIIPFNSPLEIELLLPSRSAGFIKIGDSVKIRFDAFPYEKFGMLTGIINSVDRDVILPQDQSLPISITQAVYKIKASISSQYISAYGKQFSLKPGMMADADIILDKRTLLEWILDPIYSIKGRL